MMTVIFFYQQFMFKLEPFIVIAVKQNFLIKIILLSLSELFIVKKKKIMA
jgi:hypothetical protein